MNNGNMNDTLKSMRKVRDIKKELLTYRVGWWLAMTQTRKRARSFPKSIISFRATH